PRRTRNRRRVRRTTRARNPAMSRPIAALVLAAGTLQPAAHALAHGMAGSHLFISTLIVDDPNVADEASLPTFMWLPQSTDGGSPPQSYSLGIELDKRITENFGVG